MFVYKISSRLTPRMYVGLTAGSLRKRWREHLCAANTGSQKPLYCAMRKYGADNFDIELLYTASSIDDMRAAELRYIAELKAHALENGYNLTDHGYKHGKLNSQRGEKAHNSVLTEALVRYIRDPEHRTKANKTLLVEVQRIFGVSCSRDAVRDARRGDTWTHLDSGYPPLHLGQGANKSESDEGRTKSIAALWANHAAAVKKAAEMRVGKRGANAKISEETVRGVFFSPLSLNKAAAEFGMSKKMVLLIKQRKAHRYLTEVL